MIETIKNTYAEIGIKHPIKAKIFRFVVSGGTAAIVDLALLYLFTDIFGIWYVVSAIVAFLIAFLVSFHMQKYWTFKDDSNDSVHAQATGYFLVTSINLSLNTAGIFLFVHYGNIHYLLAQFIVSALIGFESYFVYHYVFKASEADDR